MPDDGVMLLHTITALTLPQMAERGIPLSFEVARFAKFMLTEIFPGGRLPSIEKVEPLTERRVRVDTQAVAATPLRQDTGHLGRGAGIAGKRPSRSSRRRSTTDTCTT